MTEDVLVDGRALRAEVRGKYRAVAKAPSATYHFHTGRRLAERLGYDRADVDGLADEAIESFAGVGNPFSLRRLEPGERAVDVGSGAGLDSFIASRQVGGDGRVVGVDMTQEMLDKSRTTAGTLGLVNVEFRDGLAEDIPVEDRWADVVISNGVINLCPDKRATFAEIHRVLRPGGVLQFADIANGRPVPEEALRNIDLWTGWIAGGLPCAGWKKMLEDSGFVDIQVGPPVDTFGGAEGEEKARAFQVYGYAFLARKPFWQTACDIWAADYHRLHGVLHLPRSSHSFQATTGKIAWQARGAQSFAPTTVADGLTFNGLALTNQVDVRDAGTGSLLATLAIQSACWGGIATVGNAIVFGTGSSYQGIGDGIAVFTPGGVPPVVPSRPPS